MHLKFKPVACALALTTAMGLVACGGGDSTSSGSASAGTKPASSDPPAVQKLYDAAKSEGSVTWYSSATENVAQKVTDAFNEKYPGVTAQFVRASSPDLIQRYSAEADSGKVAADAGIFPGDAFIPAGIKKGYFTPIDQAGIPVVDQGTYPKAGIENGEPSLSTSSGRSATTPTSSRRPTCPRRGTRWSIRSGRARSSSRARRRRTPT